MANIREGKKESVAGMWPVTSVLVREDGRRWGQLGGLSRAFRFCCNNTGKPSESLNQKEYDKKELETCS